MKHDDYIRLIADLLADEVRSVYPDASKEAVVATAQLWALRVALELKERLRPLLQDKATA